jgi:phospholipid transport system substrate-binding protein
MAAFPASSLAGAPTDTVKATVDKVISVLKDPALKAPSKEKDRRAKIRAAVFEVFDFGEMAKRSLGPYWRERTDKQKKEFTDLFADLLERSYINKIENYSDEKVSYDAEKMDGDSASVKSRFITKRREEIPVEYRLLQENGKWDVYDVVIENVSLVNNYRVQFRKIISSSSYDDLVKKMKNKQESEAFISSAPAAK